MLGGGWGCSAFWGSLTAVRLTARLPLTVGGKLSNACYRLTSLMFSSVRNISLRLCPARRSALRPYKSPPRKSLSQHVSIGAVVSFANLGFSRLRRSQSLLDRRKKRNIPISTRIPSIDSFPLGRISPFHDRHSNQIRNIPTPFRRFRITHVGRNIQFRRDHPVPGDILTPFATS